MAAPVIKPPARKKRKLSLPIKPTQKPNGEDISQVATYVLDVAQHSLLSPAAVISALRAALELYEINAETKGFDAEFFAAAETLGIKVAHTLLEVGPATQSQGLVTPDSTLVDADGYALEADDDE